MNALWRLMSPELKLLPAAEQAGVLDRARKGPFTTGEVVVLVVWLLLTFLFVQQVLRQSTHDSKLAFAIVANLIITAPMLLAVFVPMYIRKVRRHIARQIAERLSTRHG